MSTPNYPEQIATAAQKIAALTLQIEECHAAISLIEAHETLAVATAVGSDGKAIYTNDTTRKASVTIRLENINEYAGGVRNYRQLKLERQNKEAELERLRGEFSVFKLDRREQIAAREEAVS